jgi:hypothetical protein
MEKKLELWEESSGRNIRAMGEEGNSQEKREKNENNRYGSNKKNNRRRETLFARSLKLC